MTFSVPVKRKRIGKERDFFIFFGIFLGKPREKRDRFKEKSIDFTVFFLKMRNSRVIIEKSGKVSEFPQFVLTIKNKEKTEQ